MVTLKALLLGAASALAFPFNPTEPATAHVRGKNAAGSLLARDGTPSSSGQHGGYYYYFWTDGGGTVNYQNEDDGSYNVQWQDCGNFVGGKGWNPGSSSRIINFNATFETLGNGYLAIYGWATNPLVEYYIIESFGTFDPSAYAQQRFEPYTADGSEYSLGRNIRYGLPIGGSTIVQYYAVRRNKRSSGSVTVADHFAAWKERGLKLGAFKDQIVATEGYASNGSSSVTVW
ncbi:hypothetical protein CHGG_06082 [Chaetomium globosum CBS 148.51]|uniref:Endo-1,4-beta-xylanase n=1 Tax=Chaetomium globosum (strain ATCC 6205 / CBS 148.51 / DSM 1962 / NBRC 6347 / NRRL 1970) TaxID=306901 RepID=Q2H5I3_CHAGB|nr:uncharacterized protein CHGG_06082 [Chaetomium globosum CBS 148.51]EAQ89463.1 hypothetical protein CHGG_06082 [Chaetomium globosum CBS 148.51]